MDFHELARGSGILAGYDICAFKHIQRPQGDVACGTDGRGHDVKPGIKGFVLRHFNVPRPPAIYLARPTA